MNNSANDKSIVDQQQPRHQHQHIVGLTPLDHRREPPPDLHNLRDSNFDLFPYRSHRPAPIPSQSPPMKTSVIPHPPPALSSLQSFTPSASAFPSVADSQHSTNANFLPNAPQQPQQLPNPLSLHHSLHHSIPSQPQSHHHHHHNPHQQQQQQAPHPSRSDLHHKPSPTHQQHLRRFPSHPPPHLHHHAQQQFIPPKPSDHLPQIPKVHPSSLHVMSQQQPPPSAHRFPQPHPSHTRQPLKSEPISSIPPLPMHPDPVQTFQQPTDAPDGERPAFSFGRHGFFDDLSHDENAPPAALPPPTVSAPDQDQGNALGGVDSITGHLVPALPLPCISAPQGMAGFGASPSLGNAAIVGGASEIAEVLGVGPSGGGVVGKMGQTQGQCRNRIRQLPRTRSQQMTDSQRKQRHNEHTRASRSRIDRGLERLKSVIRKVRPNQKVSKKADVLQEAVKLLKEGFRLPATESDEEKQDAQESSMSV